MGKYLNKRIEPMAAPLSLIQGTLRRLGFLFSLAAFLISILAIFIFVFFSIQESKRVLQREFQVLLRGNGLFVQVGDLRGFINKIPVEDSNYFFRSYNGLSKQTFYSGQRNDLSFNQCVEEKYLEYDLTFCRPFSVPWKLLMLLGGSFLGIFFLFAIVMIKINSIMVKEFSELFKIASIPFDGHLNLTNAWSTALKMASLFKKYQAEALEKQRLQIVSEMAAQVAHDIRSPLSALNMAAGIITEISEEKRLLIRSAIQRINDIANELLSRSRSLLKNSPTSDHPMNFLPTLLPVEIESLVSEKRIQFRHKQSVEILFEACQPIGVFVMVDLVNFKRVLSNVINNSVEAFGSDSGRISITLTLVDNFVTTVIKDNGPGISSDIMMNLGRKGFSSGKDGTTSGSGLGIYHAKKTIESFGGTLTIESEIGFGTSVSIKLPRTDAPSWFLERIRISNGTRVIVVDDDHAIHGLWQSRLSNFINSEFQIEIFNFTSPDLFIDWFNSTSHSGINELFLVDFEFLRQSRFDGLTLIEDLQISKKSILVSSHYDEPNVLEKCAQLNLKQIPKSLAGFVPIEILARQAALNKPDAVVIDDDPLQRQVWEFFAKTKGKKIFFFENSSDFLAQTETFDKSVSIYLDSNLGDNLKGEDVAYKLYCQGFRELFLATGHPPSDFAHLTYLKGVVGKDPQL